MKMVTILFKFVLRTTCSSTDEYFALDITYIYIVCVCVCVCVCVRACVCSFASDVAGQLHDLNKNGHHFVQNRSQNNLQFY